MVIEYCMTGAMWTSRHLLHPRKCTSLPCFFYRQVLSIRWSAQVKSPGTIEVVDAFFSHALRSSGIGKCTPYPLLSVVCCLQLRWSNMIPPPPLLDVESERVWCLAVR